MGGLKTSKPSADIYRLAMFIEKVPSDLGEFLKRAAES